jgi:hypothetical protein
MRFMYKEHDHHASRHPLAKLNAGGVDKGAEEWWVEVKGSFGFREQKIGLFARSTGAGI